MDERRKHSRFDTKIKIYFNVSYDIETKVDYRVIDKNDQKHISRKYTAYSKNVSSDGMCFNSEKKLHVGDIVNMDVFMPDIKDPIKMTGLVRWSEHTPNDDVDTYPFNSGIQIKTVDDEEVLESIKYDEEYGLEWSIVLEKVLGNYRIKSMKNKKDRS